MEIPLYHTSVRNPTNRIVLLNEIVSFLYTWGRLYERWILVYLYDSTNILIPLFFVGRLYGDHEMAKKEDEESQAKKEMTFR